MDEQRCELPDAIRFFDYDPVHSPASALKSAQADVGRAKKALESCQKALDELDSQSVYEYSPWAQSLLLRRCEIDAKDPRRVRLTNANHDSEDIFLDPEQLEKGESITVQHCKHFALGHSLQKLLHEQVQKAEADLQHRLSEVDRIQSAIDNNEVALTESQIKDLRFLRELDELDQQPNRRRTEKHNWLIEGF